MTNRIYSDADLIAAHADGLSIRQIAQRLRINPTTASQGLKRLELTANGPRPASFTIRQQPRPQKAGASTIAEAPPRKHKGRGIVVSPAKLVSKELQAFYDLARQARRNVLNSIMETETEKNP
jgi:transposase